MEFLEQSTTSVPSGSSILSPEWKVMLAWSRAATLPLLTMFLIRLSLCSSPGLTVANRNRVGRIFSSSLISTPLRSSLKT